MPLLFFMQHLHSSDLLLVSYSVLSYKRLFTLRSFTRSSPTISSLDCLGFWSFVIFHRPHPLDEEGMGSGDNTCNFRFCCKHLSLFLIFFRFEDSKGNKLTSDDVQVKKCGSELTNSTLTLTKTFMRADMLEEFVCKVKHVNRTEPYVKKLEAVDVLCESQIFYPASNYVALDFCPSVSLVICGSRLT